MQHIAKTYVETSIRDHAASIFEDLPSSSLDSSDLDSLQAAFHKVERAKQEWEATVDSLPELICLIDDHGRVLRANRTVETWGLGQVVDVKDRELHDLVHPGCASPACYLKWFMQQYFTQVDERRPANVETFDTILQRYLLVRAQPMPAHKHIASSTSAIVIHDVTQRKQAEEVLRRHAEEMEMMNQIEEAVLAACSPDAIAQAALLRVRRLIPFHQARVTLLKPETGQWFVLAAESNGRTHLKPGQTFPVEVFDGSEQRQPDQEITVDDLTKLSDLSAVEQQLLQDQIRSYISIPLSAEGDFIGMFSLASQRIAAFEHEHIRIAQQLADLLAIAIRQARLNHQLKHTNVELRTALEAKEQMIQNMSHELRSPLGLISGYTDLMAGGELGPLTPDQTRAVRIVRQQTDHLLYMMSRLLILQTIDSASLRKEPLDLGGWLHQITLPWQLRADQAGVQIRLDVPPSGPVVMTDPDLLAHVVENLLDNAIKFSPDGGQVSIRIRPEPVRVVVAISDEGIGISPDKLSRVFERFYQADGGSQRRFNGMGIGLALCQAVVEAHGGQIWAESRGQNQGATFYFALPR